VLLPKESDEWSTECRWIVMAHELTHVKRRDCLMQALAQLACAVYWFNPLVWFAAWRLRVERELACDDHVLEAGAKASDYASHLVEIANSFGPRIAARRWLSEWRARISRIAYVRYWTRTRDAAALTA